MHQEFPLLLNIAVALLAAFVGGLLARLVRLPAMVGYLLPDEAASAIVVATARAEAPQVPVIVRAATREGVAQLFALGAEHVIYPELEGGLEMMRGTLTHLGFSEHRVEQYADAVRHDHYDLSISTDAERQALEQMLGEEKRNKQVRDH